MTTYSFEVLIPEGLHARPCAKIVEILKSFEPVQITCKESTIKVLSILELLLQKISYGSTVSICTSSPLPDSTLMKLKEIFANTISS